MGEDGHGRLRTWGLMRKKDLNLQPSQEAVESIRTYLREEMQSQFDIQIAEMKAQVEAKMEENMACLQQEVRAHLELVSCPLTPTTSTSRSRVNPSIPSSTGQILSDFDVYAIVGNNKPLQLLDVRDSRTALQQKIEREIKLKFLDRVFSCVQHFQLPYETCFTLLETVSFHIGIYGIISQLYIGLTMQKSEKF
ncbi:hypothetical protein KSP40_PGU019925 [Platanthera guangdongensis]|uniref:Uncharacterized protein n=1 Tax=Platanthera guangdongensis TaxID=2320717 RepID=A0ABR2ML88_9ASPA